MRLIITLITALSLAATPAFALGGKKLKGECVYDGVLYKQCVFKHPQGSERYGRKRGGALEGAIVGGAVGTIIPVIGTIGGAAVGAVIGHYRTHETKHGIKYGEPPHRGDGWGGGPHHWQGGGWHHGPGFGNVVGGIVAGNLISNWLFPRQQETVVVQQPVVVTPAVPEIVPGSAAWYQYCAAKYRSFDAASGTYLGFDGVRHTCQ